MLNIANDLPIKNIFHYHSEDFFYRQVIDYQLEEIIIIKNNRNNYVKNQTIKRRKCISKCS